jgi:hypothetical protein
MVPAGEIEAMESFEDFHTKVLPQTEFPDPSTAVAVKTAVPPTRKLTWLGVIMDGGDGVRRRLGTPSQSKNRL